MNWDDLRIFLAIARTGTLRQAAAKTGVTQPTAGRRLQALEDALGVALFTRGRSGHLLTTAGEALRPTAEAMEKSAADLTRQSEHLQAPAGGTVRISVMEWPAAFLARHMSTARDAGLAIELVSSERTESFARREADIAVRHGLPLTGTFITRKVGVIRSAIYASRDYAENHQEAFTEARYQTCSWVLFTEEQAHYKSMRWQEARLAPLTPTLRLTDTHLVRDAIAGHAGLGLLPCFIGDTDQHLIRVTTPIEELAAEYWMIIPPETEQFPYLRKAIDWISNSFSTERHVLLG